MLVREISAFSFVVVSDSITFQEKHCGWSTSGNFFGLVFFVGIFWGVCCSVFSIALGCLPFLQNNTKNTVEKSHINSQTLLDYRNINSSKVIISTAD